MRQTLKSAALLASSLAAPVLLQASLPASAQIVLPGAVAPLPDGMTVSPAAKGPGKPKPHPARDAVPASASPAKAPAAPSLAGQTFYLNGRKGQIGFEAHDKTISVSHLVLNGQKISSARDECQVTVPTPVATQDLGRPNGLSRIKLSLPACPVTFDILDGAVLAVGDPASCEFPDADCRVSSDGLWGPQPATLGPPQVKSMERARTQAENAVRTNYRVLVSLTKDRPTIMGYAREQAGFTSAREEICRDYSGEGRHNYCGLRLTEARVAALRAMIDIEAARKQLKKKAKGR